MFGWFYARSLAAVAAMAAGMLAGAWIGRLIGWPMLCMGVCGVAAGMAMAAREAVHALRLVEWLRGTQGEPAPRDRGFWGEIGYRIERLLRLRDQATAAERERLQQFLAGIDASPNGVLLLDGSGRIEFCNSMAAAHFGIDPQRDRLQRATNLIRAPAFHAFLHEGRFEEPLILTDPQQRATLSLVARAYGGGMTLLLSQDITERQRAEVMRRDFVANVSHEIRTPLTVLAGFVETLAQLPLSEAERSRVLGLMAQQTERMQTLVADLLTLAGLEGSPRPAPDRWIHVVDLLRRAHADAAAFSAGRHTLALVEDEDADLAGSETELLSAVSNLLTNAIRYTAAGGNIQLRWVWRRDGAGAIEVTDDGIGIRREHLPRLTERFYRVDGSRSRETGGTGLGLAIVKHIVQRHGGEIEIESEPGKGSTFRLVFPAPRVRRRAAQPAPRLAA
jgi:two-component system phosphate regulon sensor histidine kinase PhoR